MNITNAVLKTSKLKELNDFYKKTLGFTLQDETANSFKIQLGISTVEFTNKNVEGNPYYHFACDIPSNQFHEAKEWIKQRINLLTEDGEDEIYFTNLHAKSLYFEDPAGNIFEWIARMNDNPTSSQLFSLNNIQKLSEMSLVVSNKIAIAESLKDFHIINRDNAEVTADSLSFMGNQTTKVYLLLTNPGRRWLFSNKKSVVFPLDIRLDASIILGVDDTNEFYIRKILNE